MDRRERNVCVGSAMPDQRTTFTTSYLGRRINQQEFLFFVYYVFIIYNLQFNIFVQFFFSSFKLSRLDTINALNSHQSVTKKKK